MDIVSKLSGDAGVLFISWRGPGGVWSNGDEEVDALGCTF